MKNFVKKNIFLTSTSLITISTFLYFLFQYYENKKVENRSKHFLKFNVEELR